MGAQHRALRGRRAGNSSGAAAVEFALVSLVFFTMIFGIIQYGMYFNDSLNTRQGVREAARQAVVENFNFRGGCTGSNSAQLRCSAKKEIGALTGPAYVKVVAATWAQGSPVLVCSLVKADGLFGIVPMPNGGWIRSKTQMAIEQQTLAATWANSEDDLTGTGQDWTWCT